MFSSDFDTLLKRLFGSEKFSDQPNYLIEVDCKDGKLLADAFEVVQSQTARGTNLQQYPFEVVALLLDETKLQSVRKTLENIPHRIAQIADSKPETIFKLLAQLGITDAGSAIYLDQFSILQQPVDMNNRFG